MLPAALYSIPGRKERVMKKHFAPLFLLMFTLIFTFGLTVSASAAVDADALDSVTGDTANYVLKTVPAPNVGSIGGEWAVLGLARSGFAVSESYYENYYNRVVNYVKANNGILSERKYTEYSRVAIALTAIGKNPADVGGYNLLAPLGDYNKTVYQGINGAIFALIALDCGDYAMPVNSGAEVKASRSMYVDYILKKQLPDGGWALTGSSADADVTGMALQALSNYQNRADVKAAVEKGLVCLSGIQQADGGFISWSVGNCESTAQVIVALGELGISVDDSRFVKNGNSLLDNLMSFYSKGGGFKHTEDGNGNNGMSTEQGLYALASIKRVVSGSNSLYDMSDVKKSEQPDDSFGLPGKHQDVKKMPVTAAGKTFGDIKGHANKNAIEALAARGIINGMTETAFQPNSSMTRAEFAAIVVRGLGLTPKEVTVFKDIKSGTWYSGYIGTAYTYGIVKGTSDTTFTPNSTITKEEAAAMVARAAVLCGLDTELSESEINAVLADFGDSGQVSSWAKGTLAYCCSSGIIDQTQNLQPKKAILRCEIAQMLYNMLVLAELI
jgi:hypothetical protein